MPGRECPPPVSRPATPPPPSPDPARAPRLSIIIPARNEERRLGATLERIIDYAARQPWPCEILVVDDGSTDATADVVRRLAATSDSATALHLLRHEPNRGKGFAVRRGMLHARGETMLICDADLSAPIEQLERLLPFLERGCDVVIGSRDCPGSALDPPQPLARRLAARAFRAVRRLLILPRLRDTQCGFKLFTRRAARTLFERATIDGWMFDCEVLALAERLGLRIAEVGILWRSHPDTRVRPLRDALPALRDLLRIRRRLRREAQTAAPTGSPRPPT